MSEADRGDAVRLPLAACAALCRGLPRAADLHAAMRIVEGVRQDLLGDGLLTVNQVLAPPDRGDAPEAIDLRRAWSSRPAQYPVSGRKRKTQTAWTRRLLIDGEVFVGEGADALAEAFDDSRLILSMGLRAVVNVPLLDDGGRCFATFNVLGARDRWARADIALVELLAAFAAPQVARLGPSGEGDGAAAAQDRDGPAAGREKTASKAEALIGLPK
ncbi:MAG: GAF domain-containing protein [Xylophilus ampelinus]